MYKLSDDDWQKHINFIVSDLICLQIAFILPYIVRNFSDETKLMYLKIQILMTLVEVCVFFFTESFINIYKRGNLREFRAVAIQQSLVFSVSLVILFLEKSSSTYSRYVVLLTWTASIALTFLARISIKLISIRYFKNNKNRRSLLLVTEENSVLEILETVKKNRFSEFEITGIVLLDKADGSEDIMGIPVVTDKENILDYIISNIVDEVFINIPVDREFELGFAKSCIDMGVAVHYTLQKYQPTYKSDAVQELCGYEVLTRGIRIVSSKQLFIKRSIDIIGSIVGLILMGIAYIFVAPVIYIKSPGPIFFSHIRVGKNGRKFKIYKFRSMYMDAEERKKELMSQNKMDGFMFKIEDDPRIIKGIGTFIRKSSIDELPQMWNVLKGDMSLVGTRPPTVDEYEKYEYHHKLRLAAKPGITGLWQISGRSGITDFEEVVALDTKYIYEWNLGVDIKMILKTILVVFSRKGSV